jgi:hypothetical protein
MSSEYTSVVGSGTTTQQALAPAYNFPDGTFPVPSQRDSLRIRVGTGNVVLNPEDFSVSKGIRSQNISVGTTAVPLPAVPLEFRRSLSIYNNGNLPIYIGFDDVTTSNGFPLAAGTSISIDCQSTPGMTVYAISTSTIDTRILELS